MPARTRNRDGQKKTSELPEAVRIEVVIGTLATQIPAPWLSDQKRMAGVRAMMVAKVETEIDKTISNARDEWKRLTKG